MDIPNSKSQNKAYNYQELQTFFEERIDPQEIARHLDYLLYFVVYYLHKEKTQGFYREYSDIFDFKQILQNMEKAG